jgi:hypothetical protein
MTMESLVSWLLRRLGPVPEPPRRYFSQALASPTYQRALLAYSQTKRGRRT